MALSLSTLLSKYDVPVEFKGILYIKGLYSKSLFIAVTNY